MFFLKHHLHGASLVCGKSVYIVKYLVSTLEILCDPPKTAHFN